LQNPDRQVNLSAQRKPGTEVTIDRATATTPERRGDSTAARLACLSGLVLIAVLFYHLGSAALFEPDEGRNAEKARQVLVLRDWVTPHENFQPVLDKPIFFYWLIAIAYKLFAVSEWAARLPSALAALGCVGLVYRFARLQQGRWTALWSALILLTSVEFFVLSRVVIFDMSLTFFITLALTAFYEAAHTESGIRQRIACVVLYAALGAATLIKGLVGLALPAVVIFFYLAVTRQWPVLRRIHSIPGGLLFLVIVAPWYVTAEARNPGYLYYYLWEEHFGRFATADFDRAAPWYYFIGVVFIGFFPWTLLLPLVARESWQNRFDDATLYWIAWLLLPLLFFSASKSKLPHYILPIFPPLAMLAAQALVRVYHESPAKMRFALSRTWWLHAASAAYLAGGSLVPLILPRQIRAGVTDLALLAWIYAVVSAGMLLYTVGRKSVPAGQRQLYLMQSGSSCVALVFIVHMMIAISADRSAKPLAQVVAPQLTPAAQLVQYDTHLAGLPFYLNVERPFWLITHERKKRTFLGNWYALGRSQPARAWGTVILTFDEFGERWQTNSDPLLIVVKDKNLGRLIDNLGESPIKLGAADEYLVVANQSEPSRRAVLLPRIE
jgi:4-amino-4-deoxy-L-arabinose transferase-like glycosyltransferase